MYTERRGHSGLSREFCDCMYHTPWETSDLPRVEEELVCKKLGGGHRTFSEKCVCVCGVHSIKTVHVYSLLFHRHFFQ